MPPPIAVATCDWRLHLVTRSPIHFLCSLVHFFTHSHRFTDSPMIRITNLTLARGAKRLLEGANLTVHAGHKLGLVGANGCGKSSLFAAIRHELIPDAGTIDLPPAWTIAHVAQETAAGGDDRARLRARRRSRTARDRMRTRRRRSRPGPWRRSARRPPSSFRSGRRLQRASARRDAARRAGLRRGAPPGSGRQLLRRLAHAAQSRAGADVPLRPAAARRADQSSRSRCRAVARRLARQVSGHAAAHHARPRFPRRRGRGHRPCPGAQARLLHRQLRAIRARSARSNSRCSRQPTRSSSGRSRICMRSSIASAPKPPRRSRRKAGSRRSNAWSSSPRRTSTAPSSSHSRPLPPRRGNWCCSSARRSATTTGRRCSPISTGASWLATASACSAPTARASRRC